MSAGEMLPPIVRTEDMQGNSVIFRRNVHDAYGLYVSSPIRMMRSVGMPLMQLFRLFGHTFSIQVEYNAAKNEGLITILPPKTTPSPMVRSERIIVDYDHVKNYIDEYIATGGDGECNEAIVCVKSDKLRIVRLIGDDKEVEENNTFGYTVDMIPPDKLTPLGSAICQLLFGVVVGACMYFYWQTISL